MKKSTIHAASALALLASALLSSTCALAQNFDAVDTIPLATSGRFPAYAAEPARPTEGYIRGGVARDNNVFRLSSAADTARVLGTGASRSETVVRAGVGIRHEQRIV